MNRELPYVNALGTANIETATSVVEALDMAGLNWDVEPRRIYDENGNPYDNYVMNTRVSDNKPFAVVSDRYRIVQNYEAFDFVNNLVDEGFKFDKAGQFRDGKSVWVMGQLPETKILGDNVANNIVFTNSHDGTSGVKIMMTPVRVVCSNMLNLALKKADRSWATKHTNHIYSKLEEAKYTLGLANKYMEELNNEAERLATIKMSDNEIEKIFDILFPVDVLNDSQRKIDNIAVMKNNFIQCYNADDIKQFKGTAYGAINAMSDFVSHKDPARNTIDYYENSWNRLVNGHSDLDRFYKAVAL